MRIYAWHKGKTANELDALHRAVWSLKADMHYPYVGPYRPAVRTGAFFDTRTYGRPVRVVRIGLNDAV